MVEVRWRKPREESMMGEEEEEFGYWENRMSVKEREEEEEREKMGEEV